MKLVVSQNKFGADSLDAVTQELVDKGKWKQALANVDRRMKKSRDDKLRVGGHPYL